MGPARQAYVKNLGEGANLMVVTAKSLFTWRTESLRGTQEILHMIALLVTYSPNRCFLKPMALLLL
jgi:hypothetical protein